MSSDDDDRQTARQRRSRHRGVRKLCHCARARWPKCPHPWHFNFKPKGGPAYRFSLDVQLDRHVKSRTEAEEEAEKIRIAIREGTFRRRGEPASGQFETPDVVTLASFWTTYQARVGKPVSENMRSCVEQLCAWRCGEQPFGERALTAITEDDLEAFVSELRGKGRAASTVNKYVQAITALCRWAAKKGYLTRNPAGDSAVLKRQKHAKRDRRLASDVVNAQGTITTEGEERRLLAHAGPHLQRLIIGALETGMRRGELLALQWRDVSRERRELFIRAETTKTGTGRVVPISARLFAVLEMAHAALVAAQPASLTGEARTRAVADGFVFGDALGRQVGDISKAWETCVLKAHGHTPRWTGRNALTAASRAAYDAIDLVFHDLRHEAGSRLLEAGWPLHNVAHMLGHANIATTSTYLNATRVGLQESMRRLDASRCDRVAIEGSTERPPLRNEGTKNGDQPVVN